MRTRDRIAGFVLGMVFFTLLTFAPLWPTLACRGVEAEVWVCDAYYRPLVPLFTVGTHSRRVRIQQTPSVTVEGERFKGTEFHRATVTWLRGAPVYQVQGPRRWKASVAEADAAALSALFRGKATAPVEVRGMAVHAWLFGAMGFFVWVQLWRQVFRRRDR